MSYFRLIAPSFLLCFVTTAQPILAQITPATDGTGTTVTQNGLDLAIAGGSTSRDGANLFHTFQEFNLDANQSATFFSNPEIQNILSRVGGGNPSLIDGLLRISGSNANLYLLNPSGIVFGSNAQLNLPADFTASTAWGLGFGDKIWQDGSNFRDLVGTPNQFFFDGTGGIINGADLAVDQGQTLNLFASEIINTGSLTAKQGTVNLTAVPGTNTLRLSQVGQILNLEFNNQVPAAIADIPKLLTGHALDTGLSLDNGIVTLTANQTPLNTNSGSVFVGGAIDVSGATGGTVSILGNEAVLLGADINASGQSGGGTVFVGGDFQGKGLFTNAHNTFVDADTQISASAIATGNGGKVIIWADQSTFFYGTIQARGGQLAGDGGFVEVSGKSYLDFQGLVDLRAPNGLNGELLLDPTDIVISNASDTPTLTFFAGTFEDTDSSPSNLSVATLQNQLSLGDVTVTTESASTTDSGNITVLDPITWASGTALSLEADNDIIIRASITSTTNDSELFLTANNDIKLEGSIQIGAFDSSTMTTDFVADADGDSAGTVQQGINVLLESASEFEDSDFEEDEFDDGDFGDDDFSDDDFGDDGEFGDDEFDDSFTDDEFSDDEFGEEDDDSVEDEEFDDDGFGFEYEDSEFGEFDEEFEALEDDFFDAYGDHFGLSKPPTTNLSAAQSKLSAVQTLLGIEPAIVYVAFRKKEGVLKENHLKQTPTKQDEVIWQFDQNARQNYLDSSQKLRADDQLELVMLTASGQVVRRRVLGVDRAAIARQAKAFNRSITKPGFGSNYLKPAQYFYDVLVRPLATELGEAKINNLTFVMDRGLRTLPIAALHDGERFIIENYSVGMMPSFSLTQTDYLDLRESQVLAMGASEFQNQADLPAVPVELSTIADRLWQGDVFQEKEFTVETLLQARERNPYGILHLATHGEFLPGQLENSYIQFWDQRLSLTQLSQLSLNNPPVELLVLSACRTAFGDPNAELGFAGLAIASGAKSAIGSLWYVSDEGTLGLMTRFYEELQVAPIKAEALQQAQLDMLRGNVRREGNQLITPSNTISLPPELAQLKTADLTHPYYWSGFSLVGNPW